MKIGVLAVQGAFVEHIQMLNQLNVNSFEIRNKADLKRQFDGLILPGGESTVMGKLLNDLDMMNQLREQIQEGLPVFGTCAGMILLAKIIDNSDITHLATMDISVIRNAYGRQLGSFRAVSEFENTKVTMPFIRAPYLKSVGKDVTILSVVDENIVAAKQENQLVVSFHPELTGETVVHEYFLNMIENSDKTNKKLL